MIPPPLSDALDPNLAPHGGFLAFDAYCEGAKHHSPTPLVLHTVSLTPWTHTTMTANLCGTCRDNLAVFQSLLETYQGMVPWNVQRQFGNMIRDLAYRGVDTLP